MFRDDEEKHFSELRNRRMRTCAYLDQKEMEINALRSTFCGNMNHWLCEKKPVLNKG